MTTTQEREAQPLAHFALRDGDSVIPQGFLKQGDKADEGDAGNYTVEHLAFNRYVKVWDNRTGVMSLQPEWLLWQTFQLKREDGSFIFTDHDPHIKQNYGLDMVCMLHPESPDYPLLASMGFKQCMKKHTPTRAALEAHMQKTHKRAWAALKDFKETKRRDEDRELQLEMMRSNAALIAAMSGKIVQGVTGAPAEVSGSGQTVVADALQPKTFSHLCPRGCGESFSRGTRKAAQSAAAYHARKCKGPATP